VTGAIGKASVTSRKTRGLVAQDSRERTRDAALGQARKQIRQRATPAATPAPATPASKTPATRAPATKAPAPRPPSPAPASRTAPNGTAAPATSRLSAGNEMAGFVLGLFLWGWVILPFLKDGVSGVKAVMTAKFLNKTPDGKWLP
jgi:hypothetical protein